MASTLCNHPPFRRPTAEIPVKSPISGAAILRPTSSLILPSLSLINTASTLAGTPKAIPFQKHSYPDPIPEFAAAETQKFKLELMKKLSKENDTFGDELQTVVNVCVEIFGEFLNKEYGGHGTLLVEPFTDMMVALKEKNLPGAPLAARASLLWAQSHVDRDWETWISKSHK